MLLQGECQPRTSCLSCQEPGGTSRREGEAWQRNPCTSCSCSNSSISCTTTSCTALTCSLGQTAESVYTAGECCPRQVCVTSTEECANVTLPSCGLHQQPVSVTDPAGCVHYVCGEHYWILDAINFLPRGVQIQNANFMNIFFFFLI